MNVYIKKIFSTTNNTLLYINIHVTKPDGIEYKLTKEMFYREKLLDIVKRKHAIDLYLKNRISLYSCMIIVLTKNCTWKTGEKFDQIDDEILNYILCQSENHRCFDILIKIYQCSNISDGLKKKIKTSIKNYLSKLTFIQLKKVFDERYYSGMYYEKDNPHFLRKRIFQLMYKMRVYFWLTYYNTGNYTDKHVELTYDERLQYLLKWKESTLNEDDVKFINGITNCINLPILYYREGIPNNIKNIIDYVHICVKNIDIMEKRLK